MRNSYRGLKTTRPKPNRRANEWRSWGGHNYVPFTKEEVRANEELRSAIKAEGHIDAHAEYLRRVPVRFA